jgi:hypothetical protein
MTLTNTIVLKRFVRTDGTATWVAYLPSKPVSDVGLVSAWAPRPTECLKCLMSVVPVLVRELVEPFNPSPS